MQWLTGEAIWEDSLADNLGMFYRTNLKRPPCSWRHRLPPQLFFNLKLACLFCHSELWEQKVKWTSGVVYACNFMKKATDTIILNWSDKLKWYFPTCIISAHWFGSILLCSWYLFICFVVLFILFFIIWEKNKKCIRKNKRKNYIFFSWRWLNWTYIYMFISYYTIAYIYLFCRKDKKRKITLNSKSNINRPKMSINQDSLGQVWKVNSSDYI